MNVVDITTYISNLDLTHFSTYIRLKFISRYFPLLYLFYLEQSKFDQYSRNAILEPPPTQTTTPWVRVPHQKDVPLDSSHSNIGAKSVRHLPTSIHKYINNFDNLVHQKEIEANYNKVPLPSARAHPPPPPNHLMGIISTPPPPPPPPPPEQGIVHYLNRVHKGAYLSYQNTKWKLFLKKEVCLSSTLLKNKIMVVANRFF